MARRHQLTENEVPEAIEGLYLRLQEHLEKREDLSSALNCYRAFYRLTMHEAHRPSYPEWVVKPDPIQEIVWEQLLIAVNTRGNQLSREEFGLFWNTSWKGVCTIFPRAHLEVRPTRLALYPSH